MKNKLITVILLLGFILFFSDGALACVGARPHGMGGAFIGVADDINAVYWNPAGLVQLEGSEFTWTRTLNNRDVINYDDFLATGSWIKELGLAYAFGYINIADYYPVDYTKDYTLVFKDEKIQWLIFSVAKKITPRLSIGGNIRYMGYYLGFEAAGYWPEVDSTTFFGLDLSLFYQADDKIAFGLLIQDVNRPEFRIFDRNMYYIRNVRPGIAYRITDSLLFTASIYDLLQEVPIEKIPNENRLRVGLEQKFDQLSIRAGLENGNRTLGLGIDEEHIRLDYVFLGDDLGDTHMLGCTFKF